MSNDRIIGTSANNLLTGLFGADTIYGRSGNDEIYGNQDNDALYGEDGNDTIYGGQGADFVLGGEGADVLYGNLASDYLNGLGGRDLMYGGQGGDVLIGGFGDDTMHGNKGDDELIADVGSDVLVGGEGADRFVIRQDASNERDYIMDFEVGGFWGGDVIDVSGLSDIRDFGDLRFESTTAANLGGQRVDSTIVYLEYGNFFFSDPQNVLLVGVRPDQLNFWNFQFAGDGFFGGDYDDDYDLFFLTA